MYLVVRTRFRPSLSFESVYSIPDGRQIEYGFCCVLSRGNIRFGSPPLSC